MSRDWIIGAARLLVGLVLVILVLLPVLLLLGLVSGIRTRPAHDDELGGLLNER